MKKNLWLLLDNRQGSVNQARGIAHAIGDKMDITEKKLVYNKLSFLPNWIRGKTLIGIDTKNSDELNLNFPDIVLSSSRRTVPAARYIRKKSNNKTKIVQLMYPSGGVGTKEMDLIIVPSHDSLKKQNIPNALVIVGAPNKICPQILNDAQVKWQNVFEKLPKPYTAVIIGGAIKGKKWSQDNALAIAKRIKELHSEIGGSLLITTSRRTGKDNQDIIMSELQEIPSYTYLWGEKKENPLMGFYACADKIIVTADSVSMCSEACSTGKPVLFFQGKKWLTPKHQRFVSAMTKDEYAIDIYSSNALTFTPKKTLNISTKISEAIEKL